MLAKERELFILSKLNQQNAITVTELCEELNVSRSTIQRDLDSLEKEGKLIRERGGASRVGLDETISDLIEQPVLEKMNENLDAKKSIMQEVAKEIKDGDLVFVDAGTTTLQLIPYLVNKKIKIVTYSYLLVSKLNGLGLEVYLLGGKYHPKHDIVCDSTTIKNLENYRFDKAILSTVGVDFNLNEAYTSEIEVGHVKELAMKRSKINYLVVDDSKFGVSGLYNFSKLENFDKIFVNREPKIETQLKNIKGGD